MPLSLSEREAMLAEPHIGVLSVDRDDPARAPLTLPIWYDYAPGGPLVLVTGADATKTELMRSGHPVSLCVQRLEPTVRYVTVEGPVRTIEAATDADIEGIAERYLSGEALRAYLEMARTTLEPQVRVTVEPRHWLSADLGPFSL